MRTMKNHEARAGWRGEYTLGGEAIEEIAERLEDYLRASGTEHTDILRIRFSLEEALLLCRDKILINIDRRSCDGGTASGRKLRSG